MIRRDPFNVRDTGRAIKDFHVSEWESTEKVGSSVRAEPLRLTLDLKRLDLLFVLALIGLFLVFFRVFALQVNRGGYFRETAEGNRLRTQALPAPRGVIVDRRGVALVQNTPRFQLHLRPQSATSEKPFDQSFITSYADIIGKSPEEVMEKIAEALKSKYEVVVLDDFLTHEQAIRFTIAVQGVDVVNIAYVPTRYYPEENSFASVL